MLLGVLVRAGHVIRSDVHELLNAVGKRLWCIRQDLAEMGLAAYGGRLEKEGQQLINLIDDDVDVSTRFLRKDKTA